MSINFLIYFIIFFNFFILYIVYYILYIMFTKKSTNALIVHAFLFFYYFPFLLFYYLNASSIATAQATVIPTIGLLPAPIKPIIST